MAVVEVVFWVAVGLLVYTHVGYPLALALIARLKRRRPSAPALAELPSVSLIVAAHDEEDVIADKVRNALALDYPRELLEVIVASDGSDRPHGGARPRGGRRLVLELSARARSRPRTPPPRRPVVSCSRSATPTPHGARDALRRWWAVLRSGSRLCLRPGAADRPGRDEPGGRLLALRARGPRARVRARGRHRRQRGDLRRAQRGVSTARAGASHDLSFPFMLDQARLAGGLRARAISEEKEVATIEGEFARKRRMMRGVYDEVVTDGMLAPRGYGPLYAFEIASHRVLRYASPLLHLIALVANAVLLGTSALYVVTFALQLALLAAAALAGPFPPARCCSPATTCWSPLRSPPASGTGSGLAPRGRGRRPRARGDPSSLRSGPRHHRPGDRGAAAGARRDRHQSRLAWPGPLSRPARRPRWGRVRPLQAAHHAHGNDPVGSGRRCLRATPA